MCIVRACSLPDCHEALPHLLERNAAVRVFCKHPERFPVVHLSKVKLPIKVHRIITSSKTICLQSSDLCIQPLDSRRTRPPLSWLQQIPGTETDICRKHICQFETLPKTYLPTWNIAKRGCSTLKSRSPRMSRESTSFSTSSLHRYISLYKRCSLLNSFMARAHIL